MMQSVAVALKAAGELGGTPPRGSDLVLSKVRAQSVFFRAMSCWRLPERQISALVSPDQAHSDRPHSTLFVFDDHLRDHEIQILDRVAQVLEVFLLCRQIFTYDAVAALWLKSPAEDAFFCNLSPLTWMIHGGSSGIKQVRDHLETLSPPRDELTPNTPG